MVSRVLSVYIGSFGRVHWFHHIPKEIRVERLKGFAWGGPWKPKLVEVLPRIYCVISMGCGPAEVLGNKGYSVHPCLAAAFISAHSVPSPTEGDGGPAGNKQAAFLLKLTGSCGTTNNKQVNK